MQGNLFLSRGLQSIHKIDIYASCQVAESILFGFLLFSVNTGNILSFALSTPHVSHLLCDIIRLTCFGQESRQVPGFADGFFNLLFVVNDLEYELQDSLVKCGSKFAFLAFSRSLAAYALVVSLTCGLTFKNKYLA